MTKYLLQEGYFLKWVFEWGDPEMRHCIVALPSKTSFIAVDAKDIGLNTNAFPSHIRSCWESKLSSVHQKALLSVNAVKEHNQLIGS